MGLRNVYICCVYGGRLMAAKHRGVIINISSAGAIQYFFNVPYGVGKAAVSKDNIASQLVRFFLLL